MKAISGIIRFVWLAFVGLPGLLLVVIPRLVAGAGLFYLFYLVAEFIRGFL